MRGNLLFVLAIGVFLVWPSATFSNPPEEPPRGELRIEGRFVKTLTLQKLIVDQAPGTSADGQDAATYDGGRLFSRGYPGEPVTLHDPGAGVTLPVGQYYWEQVELQDQEGSSCVAYNPARYYGGQTPITIAPDKPAVLKIGGPLTSMLEIDRQGANLRMSYRLAGVGDETYTASGHTLPPKYTIYKGDRPIATGSFEYG